MQSFLLWNAAKVLLITGGTLLLITMIAVIGTAIYEWAVPPTDMHLPGLVTAAMIFYVAPLGAILIVSGGVMWIACCFGRQ